MMGVLRAGAAVCAVLLLAMPAAAQTYIPEQADRGRGLYAEKCSGCHGANLEGESGPELSGPDFRAAWSGGRTTVDDLHYIISTTMPPRGMPRLDDEEYLEVLAFILRSNGVPAGTEPLRADGDLLAAIRMDGAGDAAPAVAPAFIEGPRGLEPTGSGPSFDDLLAARETPENWLYHTRDLAGTRYSDLDRINRGNIGQLRPECVFQLGDDGNFQSGMIVHDGTMIVTGVHVTAALDAATCKPVWRHRWAALDREVWLTNRGVAIQDGYVVRGTSDGYLLALDAADGTLLWARQIADPALGETLTMAPMIFDGMILIGPAGSENAISGWVGAFGLADGSEIWRFHTVPGAMAGGDDQSWGNPEGIVLGGGAVWTPLSIDVERGELYVPVTNPAPDIAAHLRPGDNLYTNSVVALDVRTGELRWHDQLVPNDYHDWDLTQVSPLFRGTAGGVERDLISVTGKHGLLHLLDRDTHERLSESEVAVRENVDAPISPEGTRACPGFLGGVEWNGPALSPEEGLLVTPAVNYCMTIFPADTVRHVEGEMYLGGRVEFGRDWSGWLTAVDVNDGSIRWRYESAAPMVAAVTTTAGGLALTGELGGDFLALDVATGEPLYRFQTGGPMGGGVISYEVDGRQYIAAASGRPSGFWIGDHPGQGTVVVFALPE